MFDIVYDFIKNSLLNTTVNIFGLDLILTLITIVLFYVFLVKLIIWAFNVFSRG